jgi:hypothetical protein
MEEAVGSKRTEPAAEHPCADQRPGTDQRQAGWFRYRRRARTGRRICRDDELVFGTVDIVSELERPRQESRRGVSPRIELIAIEDESRGIWLDRKAAAKCAIVKSQRGVGCANAVLRNGDVAHDKPERDGVDDGASGDGEGEGVALSGKGERVSLRDERSRGSYGEKRQSFDEYAHIGCGPFNSGG